MVRGQIISETPTNIPHVKEMLLATKQRETTLNFRAQKTLDALEQSSSLTAADAEKLLKKLQELAIPRLREQHMHKLIDTLPTTQKDVKVVLQGYAITVTNENVDKIAAVCAEFKK